MALGKDGDDSVNGHADFDTLAGGPGNDTLVGSAAEINEAFTCELSDALFGL